MVKLRIATLQLNPKIGSIKENILKAEKILSKAFDSNSIPKPDLLVLPELALTGYNFKSSTHIKPSLESLNEFGPVLKWGEDISSRYKCFTVLGYPELSTKTNTIFNSAVVFDPKGEVVENYHKSFLYETDEVWGCSEGEGFRSFNLVMKGQTVRISIGICMDLSPYKFEAPFTDFEFGTHCLNSGTDLIICPTAWLHPKAPAIQKDLNEDGKAALSQKYYDAIEKHQAVDENIVIDDRKVEIDEFNDNPEFTDLDKPDFNTLNYWILRFFPILQHYVTSFGPGKKTTLLLVNRTGNEDGVVYAGSTSIIQFFKPIKKLPMMLQRQVDLTNPNVHCLGVLGKGNEGILIRNLKV